MKPRSDAAWDPSPVFAREFRPALERIPQPLDSTAMINVILLALLFHLVQAPFVLQPGIRMDLPSADFTDGHPYDALIVAVTGERLLFADDQQVTADELPSVFASAVAARPEATLMIEADARVPHGALTEIYDMARRAGLRKIVLATRPELRVKDAPP